MFYKLIEKKRNEWLTSEECIIKERVYALYDAVYWWNEYGSECLKGNEKP